MKERLAALREKPWIAHLLRAVERFGTRLGSQFGAAITYFSVLALVPIVMFAFSVAGFVLTNVRPDLLGVVVDAIASALGDVDATTREKLVTVVADALGNYAAIGLVGLLSAVYSGAGWMRNLRSAVRAQWRPVFDLGETKQNILRKTVGNVVTLLGLVVLVALTFALATVSTSLANVLPGWLGIAELTWLVSVLRIVPIVFSVGAGWLLFMYLFALLPETREPWPIVRRGALLGAVGLLGLQYLASFLIDTFSGNPAAAIFGPVIVLMLFFNLFAQLILFCAAWIATARHEAVALPDAQPTAGERVRFALRPEGTAAREPAMVPQDVAARTVRVGIGAGYVTGAATGVGLGAALAWVFSAAVRGRGQRS